MALDRGAIIDGTLIVWFVLTAISVLYTAWDLRSTPEMKVMKPGWVLVVLFTGPIGAALYVLSCKEPKPGTHEKFVQPLWKQGLGSTVHCMAGDATGIISAAVITSLLGLSMPAEFAAEYIFGFAFGLLIFQALFMKQIMGLPYGQSVRKSFVPELLSMNFVMAGMGPVMLILMSKHLTAMHPSSIRFWGVMSLATLVGLVFSYPINVWLVAAGLKHGMGTELILGDSGQSLQAGMNMDSVNAHDGHKSMAMPAMPAPADGAPEHTVGGKAEVTTAHLNAMAVLSFLFLGAGLVVALIYGDLGTSAQSMPETIEKHSMQMP